MTCSNSNIDFSSTYGCRNSSPRVTGFINLDNNCLDEIIPTEPFRLDFLTDFNYRFKLNEFASFADIDDTTVYKFKDKVPDFIIDELKDFLVDFFDNEKSAHRYRNGNRVYSKNRFFYMRNNTLYIIDDFCGSRKNEYGHDKHVLCQNNEEVIRMYPYSAYISHKNETTHVLRKVIYDYLVADNFTTEPFDDMNKKESIFLHRPMLLSDEMRIAISNKVYFGKAHSYQHPYDYCNFRMSEEDPKMAKFDFRGRTTTMRIGKCLKKLFKIFNEDVDDNKIKDIANRLSGNFDGFELRVVEGDDITKYYNGDTNDGSYNLGSLGNSCMNYSQCGEGGFFHIYEQNAKMLVFINKDTDKIIGRAILWEVWDMDEACDALVMDRIYACEKVYLKFFDWAKENGYYRKLYQSYDNECEFVNSDGEQIDKRFSIDIDLSTYGKLPYMDTFAWGDYDVVRNDEDYGCYTARDTDGCLSGRESDDDDDYYEY